MGPAQQTTLNSPGHKHHSDGADGMCFFFLTTRAEIEAFVEAVLPGEVSPGSVQAALYVQGLRYHSDMDPRPGRGGTWAADLLRL